MFDLSYPDHLIELFTKVDNMTDEQKFSYYNKLINLPKHKHDLYTPTVIDYVNKSIQGITVDLTCCNKYD